MKNITKISLAALAFLSFGGYAQTAPPRSFGQPIVKCGSTEYEDLLRQNDPERATARQFEEWLAPKVALAKSKRLSRRGVNVVVTIPVVVHIFHDGDAVGQDENIADGQVLSQIEVLNQDFRKMAGTPGHNTNPVGADVEIEFCLAQRDPEGIYTTGINRYELGNNNLTRVQIEILKTFTQWDPEKYMNIWVVRSITAEGGQSLAGYAQFPINSGLSGLNGLGVPTSAGTDGVVLAYGAFGSEDIYPQGIYWQGNAKGRVAVHEIGHFFGLRHIWGDGAPCQGSDFCNDTPVAAEANEGCPPNGWDSCPQNPGSDMFRNYMDYTMDTCQNIFTLDQKDRMQAVLENSPRRASLTTSDGCVPGIVFEDEGTLEIQEINAQCSTSFVQQVVLRNSGSTPITTAAIAYNVDNGAQQIFNWTGSIAPAQQATVTLPQVSANAGLHTLNVNLITVNGDADPLPANDTRSQSFAIASTYNTNQVRVRILHDQFAGETLWRLRNSNGTVIASNQNNPGGNGVSEVVANVNVINGQCYTFEIMDAAGDGMCCEFGSGYYIVETAGGVAIAEGGSFGSREVTRFRIDTAMGTSDFNALANIALYPNPASSIVNITVPDGAATPDAYNIFNGLGQTIATGKIQGAEQAIDVSGLATGVYFIRLSTATSSKTLRFIKE